MAYRNIEGSGAVGDIVEVIAGSGLTGGAASGTATINVGGTASRISVSTDAVDIDAGYVGQVTITTLGTVTTGTWAGATVTVANGGTGTTTITGLLIGNGIGAVTATTTSAGIAGQITDETGTGLMVFNTSPTLITPVISSIVNTGTLTLPTSTDTLVGRATTDTLTNKSISLATNTITGTTAQFNTALTDNDFATLAGTETLTNKTITTPSITVNDNSFTVQDDLDTTKKLNFQLSGITTATTRTLTAPDLNSTIAVTANNLSVFAATTSAQLAGVVSDETGSGALTFATTPTFTTNITTPLIIGGTSTTQTLIHKTTTGIGVSGADHIFQVGNNGATEAMRILNDGKVGIGTTGPVGSLHINGGVTGGKTESLVLGNNGTTDGSGTALYMGYKVPGLGLYGARILQTGNPTLTRSTDLSFQIHGSPADNLDSSWNTPLFIQRDTSNVGIGTTAPDQKLDVRGEISIFGSSASLARLRLRGFYTASPANPPSDQCDIIVVDNGTSPVLRIRYNDAGVMKVGDIALV